jgi:hypothetical protein
VVVPCCGNSSTAVETAFVACSAACVISDSRSGRSLGSVAMAPKNAAPPRIASPPPTAVVQVGENSASSMARVSR